MTVARLPVVVAPLTGSGEGTDDLTEEPDADAADALFAVAVLDR